MERKLLCYRLSEPHSAAVSEAAEVFGAKVIFTEDAASPLCALLGEGSASPAKESEKPESECLLIAGFDRQALSDFVDALREKGARIPLKAIYTPHNRGWSFSQLISELKKEHEYMNGGTKR